MPIKTDGNKILKFVDLIQNIFTVNFEVFLFQKITRKESLSSIRMSEKSVSVTNDASDFQVVNLQFKTLVFC